MDKILSAYFVAIFIGASLSSFVLNKTYPERYDFSTYGFLIALIVFVILYLPFIILTLFAYKKNNPVLKSIVRGVVIWTFIFLLPLLVVTTLPFLSSGSFDASTFYAFPIAQLLIGIYLVQHYSLPRGFILPAIFIPGLFNLYLLIYGNYKQNKL